MTPLSPATSTKGAPSTPGDSRSCACSSGRACSWAPAAAATTTAIQAPSRQRRRRRHRPRRRQASLPTGSGSTVDLQPEGDQLAFDTKTLTAKTGKVTVDFTNDSAIPHNVTLINSANKTLGETPTFDGGTKSFNATLKAGTYTYYCSVPGHREAGIRAR